MNSKRSVRAIARIMGKSRECVGMKVARLGLEVVTAVQNSRVTTTSRLTRLKLQAELPSVEEQLKVLVGALDALRSQDTDTTDVLRLRAIARAKLPVSFHFTRSGFCCLSLSYYD